MNKALKKLKSWLVPHEQDKLVDLMNYTMSDPVSVRNLHRLGEVINVNSIPGDIVECGVWNGGSAAAILMGAKDAARKIYLYDSFEGLPAPREIDGKAAKTFEGQCIGSVESVMEALKLANFPWDNVVVRKGWFESTFALEKPQSIALLHIDADWYDSVYLSLETFYPLVSEGGIVIIDDFGFWEGARLAFYDYVETEKIRPLVERCEKTQLYWVKGKNNNRG